MAAILERDATELSRLMPLDIQDIIKQSYRSTPHPGISMNPTEFIRGMLERIYLDGHYDDLSFHLEDDEEPESYLNSGLFDMFLSYETHIDLINRRNCEYNGRYFYGEDEKLLSQRQYEYARNRVLDALVKKAIDLFSDWQGTTSPMDPNDYRGLLFKSLRDYLL